MPPSVGERLCCWGGLRWAGSGPEVRAGRTPGLPGHQDPTVSSVPSPQPPAPGMTQCSGPRSLGDGAQLSVPGGGRGGRVSVGQARAHPQWALGDPGPVVDGPVSTQKLGPSRGSDRDCVCPRPVLEGQGPGCSGHCSQVPALCLLPPPLSLQETWAPALVPLSAPPPHQGGLPLLSSCPSPFRGLCPLSLHPHLPCPLSLLSKALTPLQTRPPSSRPTLGSPLTWSQDQRVLFMLQC